MSRIAGRNWTVLDATAVGIIYVADSANCPNAIRLFRHQFDLPSDPGDAGVDRAVERLHVLGMSELEELVAA